MHKGCSSSYLFYRSTKATLEPIREVLESDELDVIY